MYDSGGNGQANSVNANVGGMGAVACWLLIKRTGWVTFVLGCRRLKSHGWTKRRRTGGYKEHMLYKDTDRSQEPDNQKKGV